MLLDATFATSIGLTISRVVNSKNIKYSKKISSAHTASLLAISDVRFGVNRNNRPVFGWMVLDVIPKHFAIKHF